MITNQTSNNSKKSQWDGRVLANQVGVRTQQQLPIRQKYIPMNGLIKTGGYGKIGVQIRMHGKQPGLIKSRNEKKEYIEIEGNNLPPLDYPIENPRSIRYKNPNSKIRIERSESFDSKKSISYDSKQSISYDSRQHSVETEKSERKSDDDYDYDIYEKDFDDDVSIGNNNLQNNNNNYPSLSSKISPSNETPSSDNSPLLSGTHDRIYVSTNKLSSLEIEVSESIQTIDKEELEMKRQIYEMSTMNLNNTNKVKRVQTPRIVKESSPFGDDLEGSGGSGPRNLSSVLCRLEFLGRGSSAVVYKSVNLKSLTLCADHHHEGDGRCGHF